jgi:hypothetical protein
MIKIVVEKTIAEPVVALFDLVADPEQQVLWDKGITSVVKVTPGPLGRGSIYRGRFPGFGTIEYSFVDYEPRRTFAHSASMPFGHLRHRFEFVPAPAGGTRIIQTIEVDPNGIWRLAMPLMAIGIKRRMRAIGTGLEEAVRQRRMA